MTASIPLRTPSSGQAVRGNGAYGDDDAAEAQGLLGQGGNGQGRGDDGDEEDASWLLEEEEAMVRSLKQDRNRKRRARAYTSKDRKLWIAELTAKPWFPAARVAFFGLFGISALVLSLFSLGSLWHTTTSHAPGAPTSSSHPPKDKTRSATSLLPANEKSNGTHPWRKTVILLSIDGAKPQYFDENKLPHLQELGLDPPSTSSPVSGLLAANMQPRFPTLTFPNHWTLLTGLNAESHGIVANDFTVAPPLAPPSGSSGRHFKYTDPLKSHDGAWWGGTPLWATAERAGVPSAVMMWPGPPRTKDGDRPSLFVEYSGTWTNDMRLERIQEWIGLPVKKRPQVMCVYTPLVDQAAHKYGPSSSQTTAALREADSFVRSLQSTISAYNATHLVDLVVVSDHGMTTTSNDKLIYLDEILGEDLLNQIYAIDGWPSAGLHFKGASEKEQEASLDRAEKLLKEAAMTVGAGKAFWVYRKEELPVRWRIKENRRIAPLWVVPKLPWSITSKDEMKSFNGQYEPVGNHGYDNIEPDMSAIFAARGPSFKHRDINSRPGLAGRHNMPGFDNTEVANLISDVLGIPEKVRTPNNGTSGFWKEWTQTL